MVFLHSLLAITNPSPLSQMIPCKKNLILLKALPYGNHTLECLGHPGLSSAISNEEGTQLFPRPLLHGAEYSGIQGLLFIRLASWDEYRANIQLLCQIVDFLIPMSNKNVPTQDDKHLATLFMQPPEVA
jgi:hypothetical protein